MCAVGKGKAAAVATGAMGGAGLIELVLASILDEDKPRRKRRVRRRGSYPLETRLGGVGGGRQ